MYLHVTVHAGMCHKSAFHFKIWPCTAKMANSILFWYFFTQRIWEDLYNLASYFIAAETVRSVVGGDSNTPCHSYADEPNG